MVTLRQEWRNTGPRESGAAPVALAAPRLLAALRLEQSRMPLESNATEWYDRASGNVRVTVTVHCGTGTK